MTAIEAIDVRKRFGSLRVLDGLSLRVEDGEVYGLLGPNGAGKSTLIRLLLGFLNPDGGQIRIFGAKPLSTGWRTTRSASYCRNGGRARCRF